MFVCAPAAAAAAAAVAVLVQQQQQQQQQQQTLMPLFCCLLVIVFHNVSMLLSHTLTQNPHTHTAVPITLDILLLWLRRVPAHTHTTHRPLLLLLAQI